MGLTREQLATVAQDYEPVIGLEVHVQLRTASKIFCGCSTRFGDPPNTNVCPVCLGLPGSLPVLNQQALELAVRAALALNCEVRERSRFARKNYFYPDLPKGYQISQYELPLSERGGLEIRLNDGIKRVGITRVHLEEDAGKSLHEGFPDSDRNTYLDFNRCGVPLIEIVSEPDLRSPAEAYEYLTTLKQILEYIEVSDCDMEKGSLRCDANLSVRRRGAEKFGVKTEVKNLNSFRYLVRALEYEIDRQVTLLENGGTVEQETRLFNVAAGRTEPMRSKEFAHDYRYFPEPDLLPPVIDAAWREKIRREMPELPAARRARFVRDYGLTDYDAGVLTATRALADYFEAAAQASPNAKAAANWIQSELLALLKEAGKEITESPVAPAAVGELLGLVEAGTLSGKMAKTVFAKMFSTGNSAKEIIAAEKLEQVTDAGEIEKLCRQALEANPQQVEAYKKGKTALFAFFVGQVMKASRGQANPQLVNDTLKRLLA
ncbi:MAG TPA: Asp-tRNA(Asn)/Glu-tRNA(Gln) amidotransferase subunit GatB [Candidatus Xenobia bacterium]|nr:Asp-tRNA(Asn)/Glu-tRNA(Gln) amidotransferase subunit GatB [Candidatus Xenobia bacterium]